MQTIFKLNSSSAISSDFLFFFYWFMNRKKILWTNKKWRFFHDVKGSVVSTNNTLRSAQLIRRLKTFSSRHSDQLEPIPTSFEECCDTTETVSRKIGEMNHENVFFTLSERFSDSLLPTPNQQHRTCCVCCAYVKRF